MSDAGKEFLASLVRHGLTLLAGYLATRGLAIDDSTVQTVAGAVVAIAAVVWSALHKTGVTKV